MDLHKIKRTVRPCNNQTGGAAVGILIVMVMFAGVTCFAAANHFVMTEKGIKVYPKEYLGFSETYLDVRKLSVREAYRHEEVLSAMAASGDLRLIPGGKTIETITSGGVSVGKAIRQLDQDYHISDSAQEISRITKEKYSTLDKQYDFKGKAAIANEKIKNGAKKFNKWLEQQ